jgi:hypothetical protein
VASARSSYSSDGPTDLIGAFSPAPSGASLSVCRRGTQTIGPPPVWATVVTAA